MDHWESPPKSRETVVNATGCDLEMHLYEQTRTPVEPNAIKADSWRPTPLLLPLYHFVAWPNNDFQVVFIYLARWMGQIYHLIRRIRLKLLNIKKKHQYWWNSRKLYTWFCRKIENIFSIEVNKINNQLTVFTTCISKLYYLNHCWLMCYSFQRLCILNTISWMALLSLDLKTKQV